MTTAAVYIAYYALYPEKWLWATPPDDATALYQAWGACLEMAQARRPQRVIRLALDAWRPLFSPFGGLATLTHAEPETTPRRKRRGFRLFGR